MDKNQLRPVIIKYYGKTLKGFFHRFIYQSDRFYSTTQVLVELDDGKLKTYDPEFVQFIDRKKSLDVAPGNKEDGDNSFSS